MSSRRPGLPLGLLFALSLCPILPTGALAATADPDSATIVAPPPPAAKRARLSAPT